MRKPQEFANHPHKFPDSMEYRAYCKYIVDGDTFDFIIDLGMFTYTYATVRLRDIDTPEIYGRADEETKKRGYLAKDLATQLLLNKQCTVSIYKDQMTFGRFVADVYYYENGIKKNFKDALIEQGLVA